ncbi:MAG: GtrA family protein [Gemmatimonas sp.]
MPSEHLTRTDHFASLWGRVAPERRRLVATVVPQFLKFGVVGTLGFLVDAATVYALRDTVGVYAAGFAGSAVSSSITWPLNRHWTFDGGHGPIHRQLPLYLAANLLALALNRSVFVALVAFVPLCARQPVFAVAAGAIAGMFVNFCLNRSVVFRARA